MIYAWARKKEIAYVLDDVFWGGGSKRKEVKRCESKAKVKS